MHGFIPRSEQEKQEMLRAIGVSSFEDLLADIPDAVRLKGDLDLPPPLSELEARRRLQELASINASPDEWTSFLGGGAYDHYIPSVIDHITSRSEFCTAYTPYQPEISQGTLQSIYEFQSLMARLTGMEIANASLYDGGTALAEAVLMASSVNRRKEVIVSGCVNPMRLEVLRSYLRAAGFDIKQTPHARGRTDPEEVESLVTEDTCCVLVDNPNFFGVVEDCGPVGEIARANGALFVVSVDPISLGLLAAPSTYGADIVVGEGQGMGTPLSYGGPYLGFMATRKEYIRRLPGRIVGRTVDSRGRTSFCLTLQTREQHIRRERATSNICTNQALVALRAAVYLTWFGQAGLAELAHLCLSKAVYAQQAMTSSGFPLHFDGPFFKELVVDVPAPAMQVVEKLAGQKILGGVPLDGLYPDLKNSILIAFTEMRTKRDIDRLVKTMIEVTR